MLKKTITYEDFNGDEQTEDCYFHLSKAELVELETSVPGGLGDYLQKIVGSDDTAGIIREFKKILLKAYGVRSADGKNFTKTDELRQRFEGSAAYSEIFMSLVTDADAAAEFINNIVPKGLEEDMQRMMARENIKPVPDPPAEPLLPYGTRTDGEPGVISRADLVSMSHDEISSKLAQGWTIQEDVPQG